MSLSRLVVLLGTVICSSAFGCSQPVRTIEVAPGHNLLLEVETPGLDSRVQLLTTGVQAPVNGPPSRYGPEFLFVEATATRFIELCVEPAFKVGYNVEPRVRTHILASGEARTLGEAGRLWASGSEVSQREAIRLYGDPSKDLPDRVRQISIYYSALGASNLFEVKEAAARLEQVGIVQTDSFLYHAVPWLEAETLMLNEASMDRSRQLVELAISRARIKHVRDLPSLLVLQSETYIAQDDLLEGKAILEEAAALSEGDPRGLAQIFNNLGYLSIRKSYLSETLAEQSEFLNESVDLHLNAKDYAIGAGDYQLAGLIFNNLGWIYEKLGDLVKAQYYLRKSLDAVYGRTSNRSNALIFANLGEIYLRFGDTLKAESFLSEAISAHQRGESNRLPVITCDLGTVRRIQGRLNEAKELHGQCLSEVHGAIEDGNVDMASTYKQAVSASLELALDHLEAAELRLAAEHLVRGSRYLVTAREQAAQRSELSRLEVRLTAYHGLISARLGEVLDAREYLHKLPGWIAISDRTVRVEVMDAVLQTYLSLGEPTPALKIGMQVLVEIEAMFEALEAERLGPAWANKSHATYEAVIEILLGLYRDNPQQFESQLFSVVERSRVPSLRKRLSGYPSAHGMAGDERLVALGSLSNEQATDTGSTKAILKRYKTHDAYLAQEFSDMTPSPLPEVFSLAQAKDSLEKNELLLYYVLNKRNPFVMELRNDSLRVHDLQSYDEALLLVQESYDRILARSGGEEPIAESISTLLPDNLDFRGVDRLLLVLHKDLHNLPVSMFMTDGRYLNELMEILSIPSLSAMYIEKGDATHGLDLAIIADPVFNKNDVRDTLGDPDRRRTWSDSLERLPWTAAEARKLVKRLAGRKVRTFTGGLANRENLFSKEVTNSRILHLASHGYFGGDTEDNVGFVLSPDPAGDMGSFITLTELMSEEFNNELVVVSGCETARGQRLQGEGSMSVARAFLSQGAGHVVATLWPVSDRASAEFMDLFYSELVGINNVAKALASAQARMRSMARYRAPYYWASYTLTSIKRPIMNPPI